MTWCDACSLPPWRRSRPVCWRPPAAAAETTAPRRAAATPPQAVKNAKAIDVGSMEGAKGAITYCTGKDTTGETKEWSKRFNAKYKAQGLSVKILEFPASADEQRTAVRPAPGGASTATATSSAPTSSGPPSSPRRAGSTTSRRTSNRIKDRLHRRPRSRPRRTTARSGACRTYTNAALLYYRKDKVDRAAADVAGRLQAGREQRRHRLPGRGVRGADVRLARARVRGGRVGALRGRQEGDDRLAARTSRRRS